MLKREVHLISKIKYSVEAWPTIIMGVKRSGPVVHAHTLDRQLEVPDTIHGSAEWETESPGRGSPDDELVASITGPWTIVFYFFRNIPKNYKKRHTVRNHELYAVFRWGSHTIPTSRSYDQLIRVNIRVRVWVRL